VTNLQVPNRAVVRLYNKRGTAELWIKKGKQQRIGRVCRATASANEVRLQLSVLALQPRECLAAAVRSMLKRIWALPVPAG
jgi:hypothetical protein